MSRVLQSKKKAAVHAPATIEGLFKELQAISLGTQHETSDSRVCTSETDAHSRSLCAAALLCCRAAEYKVDADSDESAEFVQKCQ